LFIVFGFNSFWINKTTNGIHYDVKSSQNVSASVDWSVLKTSFCKNENLLVFYFSDLENKANIELSDISFKNKSVKSADYENFGVIGAEKEVHSNGLILKPFANSVYVSCPVDFSPEYDFKIGKFLLLSIGSFFSLYFIILFLVFQMKNLENFSEKKENYFLSCSIFLTVFLFTIFLLSFLGFIFHIPIQKCYILAGLFVSAFCLNIFNKNFLMTKKDFLFQIFILFCVFGVSIFCSWYFWDYSWDGRLYHQQAIILLSEGWNPVFEKPVSEFFTLSIWVEHYPKFAEIVSANFVVLFNNLQIGKVVNYLFGVNVFCLAFYTFSRFKNSKILYNLIFAVLMVLNPVVICQTGSYYTDLLVYYLFLQIIFLIILREKNCISEKMFVLFQVMNVVMLCNIKLGGLFYTIILLLGYLFYSLIDKKVENVKSVGKIALFSMLLILLSGINPYFTNINQGLHILHPLAGEAKRDIMTINMPQCFINKNPLYKLYFSTFSKNTDSQYEKIEKIPVSFSFSLHELNEYNLADKKISGFGYLWGNIVLLTLIFAILAVKTKPEDKKLSVFVVGITLASVLINPESWWARYVPQFWAVPLFILFWTLTDKNLKTLMKAFAFFIIILLALNSLLVLRDNICAQMRFNHSRKAFFSKIKNKKIEVYMNLAFEETLFYKFYKNNTEYKRVDSEYYEKNKSKFKKIPDLITPNKRESKGEWRMYE